VDEDEALTAGGSLLCDSPLEVGGWLLDVDGGVVAVSASRGTAGGVVAMVHPIHAKIPKTAKTATLAVI
jgi:hypothetical protein